jgi:hypothetical protein
LNNTFGVCSMWNVSHLRNLQFTHQENFIKRMSVECQRSWAVHSSSNKMWKLSFRDKCQKDASLRHLCHIPTVLNPLLLQNTSGNKICSQNFKHKPILKSLPLPCNPICRQLNSMHPLFYEADYDAKSGPLSWPHVSCSKVQFWPALSSRTVQH